MRHVKRCAIALLACASLLPAQHPATTDWTALTNLTKGSQGSQIVVWSIAEPGRPASVDVCQLVGVTTYSLSCTAGIDGGTVLTFPRAEVNQVFLRKETARLGFGKVLFGAGAGFVLGGAITDDKIDYPLAAVGAVLGAAIGLSREHINHKAKLRLVYRKPA